MNIRLCFLNKEAQYKKSISLNIDGTMCSMLDKFNKCINDGELKEPSWFTSYKKESDLIKSAQTRTFSLFTQTTRPFKSKTTLSPEFLQIYLCI